MLEEVEEGYNIDDMKAKAAMKKGDKGEQEEGTRPMEKALKGQIFKGGAGSGFPDDDFEGMTAEEKDKKILDFNN